MTKLKTIFRYPGGKSKIAKDIIEEVLLFNPSVFVDVFTGGGSVSIEMLNQRPETKIILNDLDEYMYSFWKIMCQTEWDVDRLCALISSYGTPTTKTFKKLRSTTTYDEKLKAYMAIFFNRTAFSGIFRSGPIGGYDQSGKYKINCRYNQNKIISSVKAISEALRYNHSQCHRYDFREAIDIYGKREDCFLYLDPPYMKQGHTLYNVFMNDDDYEDMADWLKKAKCKWMVSHDNYPDFVKLFKGWTYITDTNLLPYSINSIKGNRKTELLISNFETQTKDKKILAWLE